jgi:hypothetical protein
MMKLYKINEINQKKCCNQINLEVNRLRVSKLDTLYLYEMMSKFVK